MGKSFNASFLAKLGLDDSTVETRLAQTFDSVGEQEQILAFHKRSASWREFALEAATEGDLRFSQVLKVAWRRLLWTPSPAGITFAMLQEPWRTSRMPKPARDFSRCSVICKT